MNLIIPYLKDLDTLVVFNQNFDIKIINTIKNEFSLNIQFPEEIIDLMDFFPSLIHLEKFLTDKVGIKRTTTNKGKFKEYYKLFKGKGSKGYDKKIEPIGTYNITDTLTPLFAYIILKLKENN